MRAKDTATLLVSLATLLGALGALWKDVRAAEKDKAFQWDNLGDQVAEVERLKERLARVEAKCNPSDKQPVGLLIQGNTFERPGVANVLIKETSR